MDDELGEFGRASIRIPPMPEEKFREVAELRDGEVCCQRGLLSFLTDNADALKLSAHNATE